MHPWPSCNERTRNAESLSVSMVAHPSTGRARRKAPLLTEISALRLRQTAVADIMKIHKVCLGNGSVRSQTLVGLG